MWFCYIINGTWYLSFLKKVNFKWKEWIKRILSAEKKLWIHIDTGMSDM